MSRTRRSWRPKYIEEMGAFIKQRFNASWVIPWMQGEEGAVILRSGGGNTPLTF